MGQKLPISLGSRHPQHPKSLSPVRPPHDLQLLSTPTPGRAASWHVSAEAAGRVVPASRTRARPGKRGEEGGGHAVGTRGQPGPGRWGRWRLQTLRHAGPPHPDPFLSALPQALPAPQYGA